MQRVFSLVARGKIQNITQAPCKEDPQCAVFSENSFCLDKKCACKNGTYWEAKNQLCWLVKELGQTCFSDQDCHPSERHAKCQNSDRSAKKVCVCDDGYYARNKTCLPEAKSKRILLLQTFMGFLSFNILTCLFF